MKHKLASGHAPSILEGAIQALPFAVASATDTSQAVRELIERTLAETADIPDRAAVEAAISIYGGDEFDDLMPGATSPEARWSANEIIRTLNELAADTVTEGDRNRLGALAQAWQVIAADRTDAASIATAARFIGAAATQFVLRAPLNVRRAVHQESAWLCAAWALVSADTRPIGYFGAGSDDLIRCGQDFAQALFIVDYKVEEERRPTQDSKPVEAAEPPNGILVIDHIGGLSTTWAGRDAAKAVGSIVGRRVARIQTPPLASIRTALGAEFPYAERVIDALLMDLAGSAFVRFRATLLVAEPGAGKSRLVRRLGELLGVPVARFDAAAAFDSAIAGTPRRWASGEPCFPLIAVMTHEIGNPIVLLDELDKCGGSERNGWLATALLPMLERETAARYPDPFLQTPIDLSWVSFIGTANDDSKLPVALRDRLRVLRIPPPDIRHLTALAATIAHDLVCEQGLDPQWAHPLDGDEIELATRLWRGGSIRQLRTIIERLIARRDLAARRH